MVQAILEGRKTMTRMVVKFPKEFNRKNVYKNGDLGLKYSVTDDVGNELLHRLFPTYEKGDRLWVRETYYAYGIWLKNGHSKSGLQKWIFFDTTLTGFKYRYSDNPPDNILPNSKRETYGWFKRPSLFMPKKVARIWLEVTSFRAIRLNIISDADCKKEGIEPFGIGYRDYSEEGASVDSPYYSFKTLWESISVKGSWELNPWVWVVEFKRI